MSVIKLPTTQSRSRSIQRFVGGVTASLAIRLGASKSMGVMGKRERAVCTSILVLETLITKCFLKQHLLCLASATYLSQMHLDSDQSIAGGGR